MEEAVEVVEPDSTVEHAQILGQMTFGATISMTARKLAVAAIDKQMVAPPRCMAGTLKREFARLCRGV